MIQAMIPDPIDQASGTQHSVALTSTSANRASVTLTSKYQAPVFLAPYSFFKTAAALLMLHTPSTFFSRCYLHVSSIPQLLPSTVCNPLCLLQFGHHNGSIFLLHPCP